MPFEETKDTADLKQPLSRTQEQERGTIQVPNESTPLLRRPQALRRTQTDAIVSKIISSRGKAESSSGAMSPAGGTAIGDGGVSPMSPMENRKKNFSNILVHSKYVSVPDFRDIGSHVTGLSRRPELRTMLTEDGGLRNRTLQDTPRLGSSLMDVPIKRNYYDDFTSVDWLSDTIEESKRQHRLNKLPGFRGQWIRLFDRSQSWILITLISLAFATIAYVIDRSESTLVDLKRGFCTSNWLLNESICCLKDPTNLSGSLSSCSDWKLWPEVFQYTPANEIVQLDFVLYILLSLILAYLSVKITLTTKTTNPVTSIIYHGEPATSQRVIYSAYGSGVPEVKTILSGFVIRKFLGSYTLLAKSTALIFAIASGMSLGKEGPFVHLATCVGNVFARSFKRFNNSGLERRLILSAAASTGVALAFGSPLGAVLFSLEEVSYYLSGNQLFKTFFCSIMSILFLRFLNPYGTGKTVPFEVSYRSDWKPVELFFFITIGIAGGVYGGLFCKFTIWWGKWFRSMRFIKSQPVKEVLIIATVTALITYSNEYTKSPIPELLYNLASPCFHSSDYTGDKGLCPMDFNNIPSEVASLSSALLIKIVLTSITFGIKVPAGIYVPSMVIGALFGRIFSMSIQYIQMLYPEFFYMNTICDGTSPCIDFGIYAMISAGAFMAGVTRMNISLSTIIFELTASYTYVLPISISIAVANWVAYAIEPRSLYELLIFKNDFPFLTNRKIHDFTKHDDLRELMHGLGDTLSIDLTGRSVTKASELKYLLIESQLKGIVDGCIPIIRNDKELVGMLSTPSLEFALDKLSSFSEEYSVDIEELDIILVNDYADTLTESGTFDLQSSNVASVDEMDNELIMTNVLNNLTDFTNIVEYAPIMLDVDSPLSLVETIFTKLGNRYICIFEKGQFIGFVHKKFFIDYCRDRMIL